MNINNIINNKILELEALESKKHNINNELSEINYYLEILNKLDETMLTVDITRLKKSLEINDYYVNEIDTLFRNINNLIEYYVVNKKTILKLPVIYELKLNEIKEHLKEIKDKLEGKLIDDLGNSKDLENLKKLMLYISGDKSIELSNELLNTLYNLVIININDEEKVELYKTLFNNMKNSKTNKMILSEESIKSEEKHINVEEVISLFTNCHSLSTVKKYLNDHFEELTKVININDVKEILKYFKEKNILIDFDDIALINVACYGNINNVKKVYDELLKIKELINEEINFKPFCDIASIAMWLNPPEIKVEPAKRGKRNSEEIIIPNNIKNKHLNVLNVVENIRNIMNNLDLFDLNKLTKEKIYTNSIIKLTPPYILKKNIMLAKSYNITNLNISSVKNDLEKNINYAIELGLMKVPKLNSYRYVNGITNMLIFSTNDKLKKQFKGLPYFEYNTSNLSNFTENEFAYYTGIQSKLGLDGFYKEFYNSDHSINDHRKSSRYDRNNNYKESFISDDLIENGKYEIDENGKTRVVIEKLNNYSEYIKVIDDFNNNYLNFNGNYFDPEIVYDPAIVEFERDFEIKDSETESMSENTFYKDNYVYKFNNKTLSRFRVLRNATILKQKYGYLNKDLLLTSIVKGSFITEDEYKYLRSSKLINELSFFESRS